MNFFRNVIYIVKIRKIVFCTYIIIYEWAISWFIILTYFIGIVFMPTRFLPIPPNVWKHLSFQGKLNFTALHHTIQVMKIFGTIDLFHNRFFL